MKTFLLAIFLALPRLASSATIELSFTGSITSTFNQPGVTPLFSPGDLWTAAFTYTYPHPADGGFGEVAQWFVTGSVGFKASVHQYAVTEFSVLAQPPVVATFQATTDEVGGPPDSTLFFSADFTSNSPLIRSTSLPSSFAEWDFPSTQIFRLDAAGQGWSWRSDTLLSSSIRQVPEPMAMIWAAIGLWWAVRRRRF